MKKLKKILALLTAAAMLAASSAIPVFAAPDIASDNDVEETEMVEAINVEETEDEVELFEESEEDSETEDDEETTAVTSLPEADNGVITLTSNVALTSTYEVLSDTTLTIDLAGFTISATGCHAITNNGTLTIEDSEGTGTVDALSHGKAAIYNSGTVTLNGGTYTRSNEAGSSSSNNGGNSFYTILNHGTMTVNDGVTVLNSGKYSSMFENGYQSYSSGNESSGYVEGTNSANPTLIINGGTFEGGLNTIKNDDGGILEINGGTFSGASQYEIMNYNEAKITGGEFTSEKNVVWTKCTDSTVDLGTLEITGGTFTTTTAGYPTIWAADDATVTISGGTIINTGDSGYAIYSAGSGATITITDCEVTGKVAVNSGTITVSGGTFDTDVSAYTASNHYYDETTGAVLQSSTIVTDNGEAELESGASAKVTLTNLEDNLDIDYTEVATIEVVLDTENVDEFVSPTTTPATTLSDNAFGVDISVVKTDSSGNVTTVEVTNQPVEIELPIALESDSVKVYHIEDDGSGGKKSTQLTANDNNLSVSGNVVSFTAPSFSTYWIDGTEVTVDSTNIAESVTLKLEEVSGLPGSYYIRLYADYDSDVKYINRFMAAELAFELDDTLDITNIGAVTITQYNPYINIVSSGNGEYEFNVKDSAGVVSDITGTYVTLGILNITGDGNFSLSLKTTNLETNTANQVQTAEISNNIVSTYITTASADGKLNYSSPVASGKITLAQTQLTINVLFPNTVSAQAADYNDMKVTLNGVNMTDNVITFGGDSLTATDVDIASVSTEADYEDATGYTTTVTVYRNYATTLKFEGAGYRTYRTSIVPSSGEATVTVWNNAMSQDMYVATSDDNAMGDVTDDVTFLAGDIVANNVIDLWDLSAVVSYFGKQAEDTELEAAWDYTLYDLNRDGKIDSRDIAMVLVSWDY